jgi:hypothetical protein
VTGGSRVARSKGFPRSVQTFKPRASGAASPDRGPARSSRATSPPGSMGGIEGGLEWTLSGRLANLPLPPVPSRAPPRAMSNEEAQGRSRQRGANQGGSKGGSPGAVGSAPFLQSAPRGCPTASGRSEAREGRGGTRAFERSPRGRWGCGPGAWGRGPGGGTVPPEGGEGPKRDDDLSTQQPGAREARRCIPRDGRNRGITPTAPTET